MSGTVPSTFHNPCRPFAPPHLGPVQSMYPCPWYLVCCIHLHPLCYFPTPSKTPRSLHEARAWVPGPRHHDSFLHCSQSTVWTLPTMARVKYNVMPNDSGLSSLLPCTISTHFDRSPPSQLPTLDLNLVYLSTPLNLSSSTQLSFTSTSLVR